VTVLTPRRTNFEIPKYSLTGDLLAFHRCGLQYRYQNRGRLPPSTPVQLWFGGFIHGVMEESYLLWKNDVQDGEYRRFPWSYQRCLEIQVRVDETRLRPIGLIAPGNQFSRDPADRKVANIRGYEAVNGWGPHLFPLIASPEVPVHGVRSMPAMDGPTRSDLYEINGVVDILASASLRDSHGGNPLVQNILELIGPTDKEFEIVLDYKGSDRPSPVSPQDMDLLRVWEWQLETYAWLRCRQRHALPVRAGVLLFLSEMYPSRDVCEELAQAAAGGKRIDGATETDLKLLRNYVRGGARPNLSLGFRLHRSVHVHALSPEIIEKGASRFDETVRLIEEGVLQEIEGTPLTMAWVGVWKRMRMADGSQRAAPAIKTCIACDHRTYCVLALETHGVGSVGRIPRADED
jgi:hypothetical protein